MIHTQKKKNLTAKKHSETAKRPWITAKKPQISAKRGTCSFYVEGLAIHDPKIDRHLHLRHVVVEYAV